MNYTKALAKFCRHTLRCFISRAINNFQFIILLEFSEKFDTTVKLIGGRLSPCYQDKDMVVILFFIHELLMI